MYLAKKAEVLPVAILVDELLVAWHDEDISVVGDVVAGPVQLFLQNGSLVLKVDIAGNLLKNVQCSFLRRRSVKKEMLKMLMVRKDVF